MTKVTIVEMKKLMEKKQLAISRVFPGGCKHKVRDELTLVAPDGKTPWAKARIKSISSASFSARSGDDKLAVTEGFTNASGWASHYRKFIGEPEPSMMVTRLQIEITDVRQEVMEAAEPILRERLAAI